MYKNNKQTFENVCEGFEQRLNSTKANSSKLNMRQEHIVFARSKV